MMKGFESAKDPRNDLEAESCQTRIEKVKPVKQSNTMEPEKIDTLITSYLEKNTGSNDKTQVGERDIFKVQRKIIR